MRIGEPSSSATCWARRRSSSIGCTACSLADRHEAGAKAAAAAVAEVVAVAAGAVVAGAAAEAGAAAAAGLGDDAEVAGADAAALAAGGAGVPGAAAAGLVTGAEVAGAGVAGAGVAPGASGVASLPATSCLLPACFALAAPAPYRLAATAAALGCGGAAATAAAAPAVLAAEVALPGTWAWAGGAIREREGNFESPGGAGLAGWGGAGGAAGRPALPDPERCKPAAAAAAEVVLVGAVELASAGFGAGAEAPEEDVCFLRRGAAEATAPPPCSRCGGGSGDGHRGLHRAKRVLDSGRGRAVLGVRYLYGGPSRSGSRIHTLPALQL